MRDLALEHVAGRVADANYLARLAAFRVEVAALKDTGAGSMSAQRAVEWLRALGSSWLQADVPSEKAELLHAIYQRIVVAGRAFVSAELTPAAYAHGLALALPEVVMASPAGDGAALTTIPIVGRHELELEPQSA